MLVLMIILCVFRNRWFYFVLCLVSFCVMLGCSGLCLLSCVGWLLVFVSVEVVMVIWIWVWMLLSVVLCVVLGFVVRRRLLNRLVWICVYVLLLVGKCLILGLVVNVLLLVIMVFLKLLNVGLLRLMLCGLMVLDFFD